MVLNDIGLAIKQAQKREHTLRMQVPPLTAFSTALSMESNYPLPRSRYTGLFVSAVVTSLIN